MAKIKTLTDREGNAFYPLTAMEGVFDQKGRNLETRLQNERDTTNTALGRKVDEVAGKGLSTNDYTSADRDKLASLPTAMKLADDIEEAKYALFIDQWNAAWGAYGKYDPVNAPDALHPFYGNKLWMTYEEAIAVMANYGFVNVKNIRVPKTNVRTNVPETFTGHTGSMLLEIDCKFFNTPVEVLGFQYGAIIKNATSAFDSCSKLRTILGDLTIRGPLTISKSPLLEDVSIKVESYNNSPNPIVLSGCPLINLASLQYIVTHAQNTKAITVTVHPDVYAKLTGDTTNAVAAALDADELAQWQQVCADAAAKNISFATV